MAASTPELDPAIFGDWARVGFFVDNHSDTYPAIDPLKAIDGLKGKSVFVTGASRGIGQAIAVHFATAGCSKIAIAARSDQAETERLIREAAKHAGHPEPQVLAIELDVASQESTEKAAEACKNAFGPSLDIVIANAGYLPALDLITDSVPSDWWYGMEVNLKGVYLTARSFVPLVLASETKLFVSVSSGGAVLISPDQAAYQISKFAVLRFNEFLQQTYGDKGLIASTVHPGVVKTEMLNRAPNWIQDMPTDTPELCADFLVWLARERREWVGGRFLSVNWDVEQLEARKQEVVEKDLLKFSLKA